MCALDYKEKEILLCIIPKYLKYCLTISKEFGSLTEENFYQIKLKTFYPNLKFLSQNHYIFLCKVYEMLALTFITNIDFPL